MHSFVLFNLEVFLKKKNEATIKRGQTGIKLFHPKCKQNSAGFLIKKYEINGH